MLGVLLLKSKDNTLKRLLMSLLQKQIKAATCAEKLNKTK